MDMVTQQAHHNKRYLPHELSTKINSVKLYRQTKDINHVIRRYHISKSSLMRWNKMYDGTKESLMNKSHRPHSRHPNAHTEEELQWIKNYHRRNPNISVCELYGKLKQEKHYSRHPGSLYRVFIQLGYRKTTESTKKSLDILVYMKRQPYLVRSGRWMLNMSLSYVMWAQTGKSFTNIP